MSTSRILGVTIAILLLSGTIIHQAQAGKMKKFILAKVIAQSLKPKFIPIPIPIPFKLKINKGEKVMPYPMHSDMMMYGGGGGGGYGGGGGGGGGYDMMGGMGGMW